MARITRLVVVTSLLLSAAPALAGNMFLPARGARALGRGGAFTAGVDDGSALYYNPAGYADMDETSFFLDGALVFQQVGYSRVDSGGNPQPRVNADMNLLPLPTLSISGKPKIPGRWLSLAGGVWVPYLGLNTWPEDGPQRYSNITLNGSLIVVAEFAAAFRIRDWFWLGVGFQNMFLHFHSRVALSACSQLNCAPEDKHFDSLTQVDTDSYFTPSGVIGAIFNFDRFRIGLNLQLPFWIRSHGEVHSRLPTDPFFANAELHGKDVDVNFDLPVMARLGFEYRPLRRLRVEVDVAYEAWSMQQSFTVKPKNVYLSGVPGIGDYTLGTMYVTRGLQDTVAVNVGIEAEVVRRFFWVRAGYAFETSATPDRTAAVLTPDSTRNMIAVGISTKLGKLRGDIGYAHVFFSDRNVDYSTSRSLQLNPIQPALAVPVGGGRYAISADVLAAGLDLRF